MEEIKKMTLAQLSEAIEEREKTIWELADKVYQRNVVAIKLTEQAEDELKELRAEKKTRCKELYKGTVERLKERGYIPPDKKD